MATYKVIQDIEAEDKLVGPFSLRQFVYAIITLASLFLGFKLATVQWYLAFPFIPPAVLFGFLAAPFGHDQPSEVWLLAKIRFSLKPRKRIWDQTGVQELVTITVPKKFDRHLTNGLSQTEVKSRLSALANTIDSRGWVVKNIDANVYEQPSYLGSRNASDRLIDPSSLPQEVPGYGNVAVNDVLDENTSPTAQNFQAMMTAATQVHKQQLMQNIQDSGGTPPDPISGVSNPWFSQPTTVVDDSVTSQQLKESRSHKNTSFTNMRKLQPLGSKMKQKKDAAASDKPMAHVADPAIIELANNDDLNVATIARQANKSAGSLNNADEVVISLH